MLWGRFRQKVVRGQRDVLQRFGEIGPARRSVACVSPNNALGGGVWEGNGEDAFGAHGCVEGGERGCSKVCRRMRGRRSAGGGATRRTVAAVGGRPVRIPAGRHPDSRVRIPVLFENSVRRLRLLGLLEGTSFVVLLGIAMPLKYLAGRPEMVRVVGMAHGLLFLAFCAAAVQLALVDRWPLRRLAAALAASVLPLGPFVLDARLLRGLEREEEAPAEAVAA